MSPMEHAYCYICQGPKPCAQDSPCNTLTRYEKSHAYSIGYYRRKNPGSVPRDLWRQISAEAASGRRAAIEERRMERIFRQQRRTAEALATEVRGMLFRRTLDDWQEAHEKELAVIRERNRLSQAALVEKEATRKAVYAARMQKAEKHYEDSLVILETFEGSTKPRYRSPEESKAARKLYKAAHAIVYAKTPAGRANSRVQDSVRRLNGVHKLRTSRPPGVGEFYRQMLTAPQACFYCDTPLAPEERVADHFIPLSKGGDHAPHNLVTACHPCNSQKRDRMPLEFMEWLNLNS